MNKYYISQRPQFFSENAETKFKKWVTNHYLAKIDKKNCIIK